MAFPSIGQFLLDGYGERPQPLARRTQMESGPAKQARIAQRRPVRRPCRYRLSAAEYATFLAWFDSEGAGALFDWTDPRTGTTKTAQLVDAVYEADMVKGQEAGPVEWVVSFQIEVYE